MMRMIRRKILYLIILLSIPLRLMETVSENRKRPILTKSIVGTFSAETRPFVPDAVDPNLDETYADMTMNREFNRGNDIYFYLL